SRPKTPRLARPYYKHLVNEWKLNKSGDGAVTRDPGGKSRQRERAGRAAPPARRPSPGWTSRDWRPIRRGDRSPHQYTGRSPPAIAAGARLTKSRPAWACANAGRPHRHRRPETHRGWPPWRSERRGGRWSANNRRGFWSRPSAPRAGSTYRSHWLRVPAPGRVAWRARDPSLLRQTSRRGRVRPRAGAADRT